MEHSTQKCARKSNNVKQFNYKNPRGRFIILSDKNKRFRTKNFYKEFIKRFLKNKNVIV